MSSLLLAVASLVIAPVPKDASFGEWFVACDNGRHCEAVALPPLDGAEGWILHVSRGAQASALPSVEASPAYGDWTGEPRAVRLVIDGQRTELGFDKDGVSTADGLTILSRIAGAKMVSVVDLKGQAVGTILTAGASAALRWMDDRQKRAGTMTAIVARGDRPAGAVPRPPALPRIQQPPPAMSPPRQLTEADVKAIQALAADYCDPEEAKPKAYRLDARHTVGIVGCLMGAYQGASLIVVIDEDGKWYPAPIEQPHPPSKLFEPFDAYFLTSGDYDQQSRLLWMSAKGRGLADCGSSASWAWDGTMFRLASYRSLGPCRGAPPGTWLSRWQTANVPLEEN